MRNLLVTVLIFLSVVAIVAVIIADYLSTRPGRRPSNPFAYDVKEYMTVPDEMTGWKEVRQVSLDASPPVDFAFRNGKLYLIAGNELQVIDKNWNRMLRTNLDPGPVCLSVKDDGRIIVGYANRLQLLGTRGEVLAVSGPLSHEASITSVAEMEGIIYAADAVSRKVMLFDSSLEQRGEFSGESGVSEVHGFIVPGGHFSLAVNDENELWITNPGLHALQNYTSSGRLRSYIQISSFDIEGFSGCCNPEHFTFMPGGGFVTSEKGIIRVKVLKESGELVSVVAPPDRFEGGTRAPAVAVDDSGNILLLDFDRNMIRIFEPVQI